MSNRTYLRKYVIRIAIIATVFYFLITVFKVTCHHSISYHQKKIAAYRRISGKNFFIAQIPGNVTLEGRIIPGPEYYMRRAVAYNNRAEEHERKLLFWQELSSNPFFILRAWSQAEENKIASHEEPSKPPEPPDEGMAK